MLERIGAVEAFDTWDYGGDWSYQWSVVRRTAG
jgi:hypothetical protein